MHIPLRSTPAYVEPQAPPSSYAIADVLESKPGAFGRTAKLTGIRALVIAPGLFLGGVRGPQDHEGEQGDASPMAGPLSPAAMDGPHPTPLPRKLVEIFFNYVLTRTRGTYTLQSGSD